MPIAAQIISTQDVVSVHKSTGELVPHTGTPYTCTSSSSSPHTLLPVFINHQERACRSHIVVLLLHICTHIHTCDERVQSCDDVSVSLIGSNIATSSCRRQRRCLRRAHRCQYWTGRLKSLAQDHDACARAFLYGFVTLKRDDAMSDNCGDPQITFAII